MVLFFFLNTILPGRTSSEFKAYLTIIWILDNKFPILDFSVLAGPLN